MTESPFGDSGFAVLVFSLGDDPIASRTSSNPMEYQTIFMDGGLPVATSSGETRAKLFWNAAWYKEKAMLAEAQEAGQILDEEQLAFLADPRILADQAQTIIPHNAAFQTEDLDTYDSDCDDLSTAQAILMANISNYGSDIISEVPNSETYLNDMDNQSV
ncbi:hypothetical protein Tco_1029090 [Tanacetum coccineum]|uniref:Uncharacterized protein n=1 Tax=Tanacetum coccineum TaxID=301880 RepID=A0ABQ5G2G8_9ASTR